MVAASLPSPFIPKLLRFLVDQVSTSRHVEFNMRWVLAVLSQHGPTIRERAHTVEMAPLMRALQRAISSRQSVMSQLADDNCYSLRYLGGAAVAQGSENDNASDMSSDEEQQQQQQEEKEEEEEEGLESEDEEDSGSWIVPERAPKRVKS
jgi:periodic tryptophan protein 2